MRLKLARFENQIDLDSGVISTLEIIDHHLFARVIESMLSELGERAVEPYHLFEAGKSVSPKGKLLFLNSLPNLPVRERQFEKMLFEKMEEEFSESSNVEGCRERMEELALEMNQLIEKAGLGMWGSYGFGVNWNLPSYLKAFGFGLNGGDGRSILDRCIGFFGLCVDIGYKKPLVFVNAKSFFSGFELDTLFEQLFFHGLSALFIESWADEGTHPHETKSRIDLGFSDFDYD